jgi:hypothetical protein
MSKTRNRDQTMFERHVAAMRPVLERRHAAGQVAVLKKLAAALEAGKGVEAAVAEAASAVYWQGVEDGLDLSLPEAS